MTELEIKVLNKLDAVTFLPGSFEKRFVGTLTRHTDKDLTEKQRAYLLRLFHLYRRQIPGYEILKGKLIDAGFFSCEGCNKQLSGEFWEFREGMKGSKYYCLDCKSHRAVLEILSSASTQERKKLEKNIKLIKR